MAGLVENHGLTEKGPNAGMERRPTPYIGYGLPENCHEGMPI